MALGDFLRSEMSAKPETPQRNGSDQTVVIRTLGAPVEITLAGEIYLVTGGSLRFHEVLSRFQDNGKKRLQEQREAEIKVLSHNEEAFNVWSAASNRESALKKLIETIERQREESGNFDFEAEKYEAAQRERKEVESVLVSLAKNGDFYKALQFMRDMLEIKDRMTVSTNEHCLRLVQFILLNSRNPKWYKEKDRVDTQGFPSNAMLDDVVPFDELYEDADINELSNVIDVFRQINQPELFRKNALSLTGIQSSSRGQDS